MPRINVSLHHFLDYGFLPPFLRVILQIAVFHDNTPIGRYPQRITALFDLLSADFSEAIVVACRKRKWY
jgi:hypothetical protein